MKRRLLSGALAVVMTLTVALPAFAAEPETATEETAVEETAVEAEEVPALPKATSNTSILTSASAGDKINVRQSETEYYTGNKESVALTTSSTKNYLGRVATKALDAAEAYMVYLFGEDVQDELAKGLNIEDVAVIVGGAMGDLKNANNPNVYTDLPDSFDTALQGFLDLTYQYKILPISEDKAMGYGESADLAYFNGVLNNLLYHYSGFEGAEDLAEAAQDYIEEDNAYVAAAVKLGILPKYLVDCPADSVITGYGASLAVVSFVNYMGINYMPENHLGALSLEVNFDDTLTIHNNYKVALVDVKWTTSTGKYKYLFYSKSNDTNEAIIKDSKSPGKSIEENPLQMYQNGVYYIHLVDENNNKLVKQIKITAFSNGSNGSGLTNTTKK